MKPRRLEEFTTDELLTVEAADLTALRVDAYRRHVEHMPTDSAMAVSIGRWVERMATRYGQTLKVWQNEVAWREALLIVRYGEDPAQWPNWFTQADLDRAHAWMLGEKVNGQTGRKPRGVRYHDEADFVPSRIPTLTMLARTVGAAILLIVGVTALMLGQPWGMLPILGTALSNFWENELIDHLFRGRSYSAPTDHWIALYTAAPGETGGGTEVSGGAYARVQVAAGFTNWLGTGGETTAVDSAGTGGVTSNRNAVTFPTPSANWGLVTHFASLDAATVGNFFFYGALTASKNINNGDPAPSFAPAALTFTLA